MNLSENTRRILSRITSVAFGACVLAGLAVLFKGFRSSGDEPEWGRVLMIWGGVFAVLFAAPLFLKVETQLGWLISAITAGVFLFLANIYLTFREPPYAAMIRDVETIRLQQPGADKRMPFAFAQERTAAGQPTVPFLVGRIARRVWKPDEILPLAGVSNSTTALCNEPGPYIMFTSDEHGFRNRGAWPEKADYVVVGDSFAQGECVPEGKDNVALLRARGHNILSLGASGSGPLIELAIIKEYGLRLKPKIVFWYFFEDNDLEDLHEEMQNPLLTRYLFDKNFTQKLWERQPEIDAYWRKFLGDVRPATFYGDTGKFRELLTLRGVRALVGLDHSAHTPWRGQLTLILSQAKKLIEENGGRLHFVFLPSWGRYGARPKLDKEEVLSLVKNIGIETTDFDAVLSKTPDVYEHFPFGKIGHYNEKGHRLLADTIAAELQR